MKFLFLLLILLLKINTVFSANIGLLVMATGKYISFVPPLVESAEKNFLPGHNVTFFIFTDGNLEPADNIICLQQSRLGWPYDTMMRYHAYAKYKNELMNQDYLFACDADMRFVDIVGDEILGERVATIHPGFYKSGRNSYSYDTNPKSTAFISDKEGKYYFAGGFYGASKDEFFKILDTNIKNINKDLENGIVAVWHDESHWNRYCIDNPPTIMLSPSYCYPESWNLPFTKRLIALDKNHSEMRNP